MFDEIGDLVNNVYSFVNGYGYYGENEYKVPDRTIGPVVSGSPAGYIHSRPGCSIANDAKRQPVGWQYSAQ